MLEKLYQNAVWGKQASESYVSDDLISAARLWVVIHGTTNGFYSIKDSLFNAVKPKADPQLKATIDTWWRGSVQDEYQKRLERLNRNRLTHQNDYEVKEYTIWEESWWHDTQFPRKVLTAGPIGKTQELKLFMSYAAECYQWWIDQLESLDNLHRANTAGASGLLPGKPTAEEDLDF